MLTTRHGRRRLARHLAAGLVDATPTTLGLPGSTGSWATLPESRRRQLTDRAEAILDEDDYAVAFRLEDTADAVDTGLIAA